MARNRAMIGAGAKKMGGAGIKPSGPPTPMAGKPPMSKPPMGGGPPPMGGGKAPLPKPPMGGGAGMAPPMPGGSSPIPPPGAGSGIGGGAGFAQGGSVAGSPIDKIEPSTSAVATSEGYKRGGVVGHTKPRHNSPGRYKS